MKTLVAACPQAFAELILQQTDVKVTGMLPTELKGYDLEADGLLMVGTRDDEDIVVLLEFQSVNDKDMGERLLEYSFRAKKQIRQTSHCLRNLSASGWHRTGAAADLGIAQWQ